MYPWSSSCPHNLANQDLSGKDIIDSLDLQKHLVDERFPQWQNVESLGFFQKGSCGDSWPEVDEGTDNAHVLRVEHIFCTLERKSFDFYKNI